MLNPIGGGARGRMGGPSGAGGWEVGIGTLRVTGGRASSSSHLEEKRRRTFLSSSLSSFIQSLS